MYQCKRVYDYDPVADQPAALLDRLWPRGIAKDTLQGVVWEKDATPSAELRTWLHADPAQRFAEFARRYREELQSPEALAALQRLRELAESHDRLTLLSAVKTPGHSHLSVLLEALQAG